MSLSVAEIERWDAGDVREVFHAATGRARAAFDAADGLADLPVLRTWGGHAAEAAGEAIGRTRADLDSHGTEVLVVAEAARRAADSIDAIHADLARLKSDAAGWGLEIDPWTASIVPRRGSRPTRRLLEHAVPPLQARLNAIVEQANSVDLQLAAALHLADGTTALSPSLHTDDPQVPAGPLPEDPAQFHDLWRRLSPQDRDLLYRRDPAIGNHPGMPTGDAMNRGSDHYNRRHLAEELAAARARGSDALADLEAVDRALADADRNHADARLMLLDLTSGKRVHAAIAVGNPDTATHVSVTTPGLNSTVAESITTMTDQAVALQRETLRQLAVAGRTGETVAAIAWIGYDAPQIPGPGVTFAKPGVPLLPGLPLSYDPLDIARSELGAYHVSHDAMARAGAVSLARFYDGIQGARDVGPAHLTAIGHSYGSLTTGLALQQPGDHGVSDAIFYGSPGVAASTPAQLNLGSGHVFAMEAPDDPIQWVYDAPPLVKAVAAATPLPFDDVLLALSDLSGTGDFGPNPATNPAFVRLETGPAVQAGADGPALHFEGADGHSEYAQRGSAPGPGGLPLLRTPGYNIAAVVGGLSDRAIKGD